MPGRKSVLTPFSRTERAWFFAVARLKHLFRSHTMIQTAHMIADMDTVESHDEDGIRVITAAVIRGAHYEVVNECLICEMRA